MGLLLFGQSNHTDVEVGANPVGLEMVGTENTNEPLLKTGVQAESLGKKTTLKSNLLINERCAGPWERRADGAKRGDGAQVMEKEWFLGSLHQQWLPTAGSNCGQPLFSPSGVCYDWGNRQSMARGRCLKISSSMNSTRELGLQKLSVSISSVEWWDKHGYLVHLPGGVNSG